jgi:uncharacterized membrane protein YcaP (DUF421 family)
VEIVIRALVVFFFLWTVTRVAGRTTLGELSTFDLLLYVTMGDLVQQAVTQQDYSVTSAFLAVGVFTLLTVALSYSSWKWPKLSPFVDGSPVPIIEGGKMLPEAMKGQRLSFSDLATAARQQGIRRISDIEVAVLEADGRMSFFTYEDDHSGSPESTPVG